MILKSRYKGPFKQEWYSVCSAHMNYDKNCNSCNVGSWRNVYKTKCSQWLYKISPRLWKLWANRKHSSFNKMVRTKAFLKAFPNFSSKGGD